MNFGQLRLDLAAEEQQLVERIIAELDFAEGLSKLHPNQAAEWEELMGQSSELLTKTVAGGQGAAVAEAVAQAEQMLAPIGRVAKTYTIHCVGHAHIDMNWQWSWPETVAITNDTFSTVLKLMEEFPDFCFTQSQGSVYEIVREHNPDLLERIKQRVAEGRWEIVASHWVEGDKNLASGESLTRHLLYTRRFIREHFNLEPEDVSIDWSPDAFGHAYSIPMIDSRGAVKRYYAMRTGRRPKPPVFWWSGPDGSRLLVYFEQTCYNGHIHPDAAEAMLRFCQQTKLTDYLWVYGVGDHGGGPTRRDLIRCGQLDSWPIYPRFKLTTTGRYYAILESQGEKFPTLAEELNFELTGCYTSQSQTKMANRFAECRLEDAEWAAVLAYRSLGRDYPADALRQAWTDTLFGHFHDILPGSGVRATRQHHLGLFQKTCATTGMVTTNSLRALAAEIDTSFASGTAAGSAGPEQDSTALGAGAGWVTHLGGVSELSAVSSGARPFVVFNPTASERHEVVRATLWDIEPTTKPPGWDNQPHEDPPSIRRRDFVVRTADGQVVPAQQVGAARYWDHNYVELVFPASVGPMAYSSYAIEEGGVDDYQPAVKHNYHNAWYGAVFHGTFDLENEFLAVEFDRLSGGISKLIDKASGRDLADSQNPLGVLEYILERPRTMSSWVIGDTQKRLCPLELYSFDAGLQGPHLVTRVAKLRLNDSTIAVTYALKAGQPWLEIDVHATWLERGGPEIGTPMLRMQFPLAIDNPQARYEIPYGSIQRDLNSGQEVPALRWANVTGRSQNGGSPAGCALLNDCKYGHSLDGSTLRLTLIRSSYDPDPLPEIGEQTMRLALVPHGGNLPVADLVRLGTGFNHPLQVVGTDVHDGRFPARCPAAVTCSPDHVVVSAVKKSEDDEAVVFRLFEAEGRPATVRVTLDPRLVGQVSEAVEVDLIERPIKTSTAQVTPDGFTADVPAHGLTSVKVGFGE